MNKIRYAEKKYLCQYDLDIELFNEFGIEVNDLVPSRSVYILFTNSGKKVLKLLDCDKDTFMFITKSLEYIQTKCKNTVRFNKSINKNYIVEREEKEYVLMDLVEGRESNFSNPLDIGIVSKELAKFNVASKDIIKNIGQQYKKYILDYEKKYMDYINLTKNLNDAVKHFKYKNEFDDLFLQSYDYYKKCMEKGMNDLQKSDYRKYLNLDENIVFLHQDLINHNLIIDGEEAYFIDFDYGRLGLKVQDIRNLIMRVMKNTAYDVSKYNKVINEYEKVEKLSVSEKRILNAIIEFPMEYCSIIKDYYYRNKQWDEEVFVNRFKNKLEFQNERDEFIKQIGVD